MAKARGNGLDATKTSFFRANPGPPGALLGDSLLEARAAARKERGTCKISSGRSARRGRRSSGLVGVGRHGAPAGLATEMLGRSTRCTQNWTATRVGASHLLGSHDQARHGIRRDQTGKG